ncbi:MAG TPA: hypothetical protein VKE69_12535, partial [Planctomycetota bacterium]|nr:hypothetical protein [Planctomycetota bacterium]
MSAAATDDARWLWAFALADVAADENGSFKLDAATLKALKSDAALRKIPMARAEAAKELARAAAKLGPADAPSCARWLLEVGREVARRSPALEKKHASELESGLKRTAPKTDAVVRALAASIDASLGKSKPDDALVAARCLRGLAAQATQKDLASPAPDMESAMEIANKGILRARAALGSKETAPKSIEELEALTPEERDRFNAEHAAIGNPAVALSPTGPYRVETTCGLGTLLAAAKQIELHHQRLARWNGKDPFAGRQGLVRVLPECGDLESEGSPFWWAGGFQSGDVTTVRLAHGTGSGLGHALTHELTHRFDGAMHPSGLASWLAEGRAVWTGGAYGPDEQESFTEHYASFGSISEAYRKGYGDPEKLKKLILGTIDDYRDNYSAGHALWVFLASWENDGKPLFRPQLDKYLGPTPAGGQGPQGIQWFSTCFADGKAGRPAGIEAFAQAFGEFIKGFWWESPAPWLKTRYQDGVARVGADPWIYDAPTWSRVRDRAEPYFGQEQAHTAGLLLARIGPPAAAIAALEWSLDVDEIDAEAAHALVKLYEAANKADAVWCIRSRLHRTWPAREPEPPAPPAAGALLAVSKTNALLAAIAEASKAQRDAGHADAAAALAADHDRLAALVGRKPLPPVDAPDSASRPAPTAHPLCEAPVAVGAGGFLEDRLKDYEEFRVANYWHATPGGDLVLGKPDASLQTGKERGTSQIETFARGKEWVSGPFSVKARVRFLTSYASGAAVIGYRRRDRQLRVAFSAGDFAHALGKKETDEANGLPLAMWDLRERESGGALAGRVDRRLPFGKDDASFELEVLVDGPMAYLYGNGKLLGSHCAATGIPIEGFVGFASDHGVISIESPTIQRHRRAPGSDRCLCRAWPSPLDLSRKNTSP